MSDKKKRWIKKATENAHGQFKAKAESAGEPTRKFAEEHKDGGDKTAKQARLALALMGTHKAPTAKSMRNKMYGSKE